LRRIGGVEEAHGGPGPGAEALLAPVHQDAAHAHGYVAEVDVHRAGILALVADGAVIRQVVHLVEMAQGKSAAGLLLVEEGLENQPDPEDLVARRVE
jgi:hypothetical protein